MGTLLGAVAFAVLLLFAIFFHELGHFVTARWAGIKVRQFFVGFGPTLWSIRRGRVEVVTRPDGELHERPETEYGVKALPLGGYVRILGMSPFEEVPPHEQSRSFNAAPAWKRAIVLVAGSATHVVTALVLLLLVFSALGTEDPDRPTRTIDTVFKEVDGRAGPAYGAGIRPGDQIVAVAGRPASSWDDVRGVIRSHPGADLAIGVRSPHEAARIVHLTPVSHREDGRRVGMIGVAPVLRVVRVGPVAGVGRSGREIGRMTADVVRSTPKAFTLRNLGLVPGARPTAERPVSLVGAGRIAAGLVARGQIVLFLFFFVEINLFIGLVNMLPLPPLDGGHLLVLGVEKVRRKPVDPRTLVPIMAVVTSLLVILAVSLLFQDIFAPLSNPFQ